MNVENRKLFANRDARKRLAEMGGILASSPELMGEAMKFANGGGGELSYIVSNIPGLVAQYEYVRVDVPTMQMLNDRFPQLMQQATVEEESMAPSGVRTRARPQTILGTRISRMMETQQAAPEEVVLESAPITSEEQPSLMDRIRTTVPGLSQYEGQPNPYVEALKNAGLSEDALLTSSVTPSEELMSMGPMEMERLSKQPILQQELAKAVLSQQPEVPSAKDLMAGPIYPAEERSSTSKLSSMDFSTDPTKGYPFPTDVPKDDPKYEAQSVVEAMTKSSNPAELEAQLEAIQVRKEEARRVQEMADAEREQMTGMPDLAAPEKVDVDVLLDAVKKNNPAAATEALIKRFMDRDSDIVPSTVDQLTKEPPKGDPDDDKPDAPKTRKQRMLETVDMISELFGIREKDKAEDMYDLMATIGFAMASGESPNAMKNIADAFLVGAQMKRADKKEDKKLDQAIKTLAVKDVLEQESDERALDRLLAKEERAKTQDLEIYVQRLVAAKQFEDPDSIFANEPYKSMAIIARQDPPNTDPDQTVIERLTAGGFNPAAINTFIKAMQLSTEAGAGAGVTPGQAQTLADIPTNDKPEKSGG